MVSRPHESDTASIQCVAQGHDFRVIYERILECAQSLKHPLRAKSVERFARDRLRSQIDYWLNLDEAVNESHMPHERYDNYDSYLSGMDLADNLQSRQDYSGASQNDYPEGYHEKFAKAEFDLIAQRKVELTAKYFTEMIPGLVACNSSQIVELIENPMAEAVILRALNENGLAMPIAFCHNDQECITWDHKEKRGFLLSGPLSKKRIHSMRNRRYWNSISPSVFCPAWDQKIDR
jgi:hypothetical protein